MPDGTFLAKNLGFGTGIMINSFLLSVFSLNCNILILKTVTPLAYMIYHISLKTDPESFMKIQTIQILYSFTQNVHAELMYFFSFQIK